MEMRKRTPASFVLWTVASLLMALVLPASLHAQETRARISGRVTDTTKAVIPGASVTVKDVARGTTASATTNEQGLFQLNYLLPGTYTVAVELQGFKKHVEDNVVLQISETRNLAIVLEVGTLQESISVVAESSRLNTSDANMGLVVDQQRLASLPLIHGDPYKIMGLAPGLAHTGDQRLDRPFEPTHVIGYAMDGTRGNRSDLLIDGLPSTATANANEVIATYVPPSDLVQEFKVQTATFDSQFGNTEGGVTSMVIKSGTNRHTVRPTTLPNRRAGARTTSSGRLEARRRSRAIRTGPAARSAAPFSGTRPSTWSATNASRTNARVSTSRGTRGFRPRRSATATSPRTRHSSRFTIR